MNTREPYRVNAVHALCRAEGWTLSHLSRLTGIDRTRLHRLAHSQNLRAVLTVREALLISGVAPSHNFIF